MDFSPHLGTANIMRPSAARRHTLRGATSVNDSTYANEIDLRAPRQEPGGQEEYLRRQNSVREWGWKPPEEWIDLEFSDSGSRVLLGSIECNLSRVRRLS
jgi:phage-related protein